MNMHERDIFLSLFHSIFSNTQESVIAVLLLTSVGLTILLYYTFKRVREKEDLINKLIENLKNQNELYDKNLENINKMLIETLTDNTSTLETVKTVLIDMKTSVNNLVTITSLKNTRD